MSKQSAELFWKSTRAARPVERRIWWRFGEQPGQLTISIAPEQPVPDVAAMSEGMVKAAVVPTTNLKDGQTIVPQLVFATISKGQHGDGQTVRTHNGRELPVLQLLPEQPQPADQRSYAQQMKLTKQPMPTAAVSTGDHAVGFIVANQTLAFYPIVTVSLDADIKSFREGSGSTTDLVHLLPFQS